MRRLKTLLVLLLMGGVFVCFAGLPWLAAQFSDDLLRGGAAQIQAVELVLNDADPDAPGYMLRKLALECSMTDVPITPQQASMTEEEVIAAARVGMDIYVDVGIFEWFDYTYQGAEPYFAIDPSDKSHQMIFWSVVFTNEESPYGCLLLHIDDETGRIIYISYEDYGISREFVNAEATESMMDGFIHAFLSPLSLLPSQVWMYEDLEGTVSQQIMRYDNSMDVVYGYRDWRYGDINVVFSVTTTGFSVTIR